MSDKPTKVLLVEDNLHYAHLIRVMVFGMGSTEFELTHVERLSDALEHLSKESWDVVLLDLLLPDSHGLDTVTKVQAQAPNVPIVVLTGLDDEALAIKAMQEGAQDYLVKGIVDGSLLKRSMRYAIERKRAEEVFKTLAISSPVGIYIVQDRAFQFASPQFQELVGYSEEELLSMDSLTLVHPEDREMVRETAIRMLKAGRSSPYEYRYISKNGQTKWVLETVASIQYQGRRATLGNFLDITERKQMEEEISHRQDTQTVLNSLLRISLEDIPLKGLLKRTIDLIFSIPWLAFESRGSIFLVEDDPEVLVMKAQNGLEQPIQRECARVPFGRCLCGQAALTQEIHFADSLNDRHEIRYDSITPHGHYCVPIVLAGKTLGVINMYLNEGHRRSQSEEEFLIAVANTLAGIIERKQVEEKLRESEEKYHAIFEQAADSIVLIDTSTEEIVDFNDRAHENLGYTREEFAKLKTINITAPESAEEHNKAVERTLKSGVYAFEIKQITKNGEKRDVTVKSGVFHNPSGKTLVLSIWHDITERKRAEEELRRAKEQFQALVEESPLGVAMVTKDGRYQYLNPKFVEMFGYTLEDIPTRQDWFAKAYPDPEYRKRVISSWETDQRIMAEGDEVSRPAFTVTSKGGSEKIIQFRSVALATGDYLIIHEDITESKRAEEELKLRAQILDGATDSIIVHGVDDNFVYVNEAACRTHGYSREEFMKMKITQLVAQERASGLDSDRQELLEKGHIVIESAHLRKDGSIMPVEVHARTLESGGRKLFLTVIRDITERKQAEEERRELENRTHLNSRLASIGEIAAGIAHEINNPLTAVIGFAQLLMDTTIPDDAKKDIAVIYKEARRAAEVAKNLLVFARKREPVRQPTDINSAIREVLKLRAYEEKVNNIQVNTRFASKLPEVMADYSQLQQVFLNIIINAEAAMLEAHNGGALTVTTQKVNGTIKVSFTDNGPGIAKENLERVFDPFFTTKEVGKGTGLGLSLCHGIVVQHGGRIYAKSKWGKGSTFVVELPINAH